jgi:hypothetical protein
VHPFPLIVTIMAIFTGGCLGLPDSKFQPTRAPSVVRATEHELRCAARLSVLYWHLLPKAENVSSRSDPLSLDDLPAVAPSRPGLDLLCPSSHSQYGALAYPDLMRAIQQHRPIPVIWDIEEHLSGIRYALLGDGNIVPMPEK